MEQHPNNPRPRVADLLVRVVAMWRAQWWRAAIVMLGLAIVTVAIALTALAVSPALNAVQQDLVAGRGRESLDRLLAVVTALGVPVIVILLLVVSAAFATVAIMVGAARAGEDVRLGASLARAIRRSPVVLAATALATLAVVGLVVAAPAVMIGGLLWLAAVPLLRVGARRWSWMAGATSWRRALLLVIPFGAAVYLAVQWSLALPAAALGDGGPVRALEWSRMAVDGQRWRVVGVLVGAFAVVAGVQWALGALISAPEWAGSLQGVVQLVIGSLPVVAATVLLGARPPGTMRARPAPALGARVATAVLTVVALTASFLVPGAAPALAADAPVSTQTTMSFSPSPSTAGEIFDINVTISGSDGSYPDGGSLIVRGDNGFPTIERGVGAGGEVTISGNSDLGMLPVGVYAVTAEFMGSTSGDGTVYEASTGSASHTVNPPAGGPVATTITAAGVDTPSQFGDVRSITLTVSPTPPTNTVIDATIDSTVFTGVSLIDGVATLTLADLGVGDHTITANYAGAPNLLASSYSAVHTVVRASTSVTVTASPVSPSRIGTDVTFSALVVPTNSSLATPTGTVTFTVNGTQRPATPLVNGEAWLGETFAAVGTASVTATYSGDAVLDASAASVTHEVIEKSPTSVAVTSDSEFVVGRASAIRIAVTGDAPSGFVWIGVTDADDVSVAATQVSLVAGEATYSFVPQAPGAYVLTAIYNGDAENVGSSNTLSFSTGQAASSVSAAAQPATQFGADVTFSAVVTSAEGGGPTPTGTVTFTLGSQVHPVAVSGGRASLTLSDLPVGVTQVQAAYSGDGNYAGSDAPLVSHTVTQAPTTTVVSVTGTALVGESNTITVTVASTVPGAAAPTGSVIVTYGSFSHNLTLVGGTASVSTSDIPAGVVAIAASYSGSVEHTASSTSVNRTVLLATTTTAVALSSTAVVIGETTTATVTVTAQSPSTRVPTGTVYIMRSGAVIATGTLVAGVASIPLRWDTTPGSDPLQIEYSGDAFLLGSTATSAVSVSKAAVDVTLSAVDDSVRLGDPVALTITVAGASPSAGVPTSGSLAIYRGGNLQTTIQLGPDGTATHDLPATWIGTQNISVRFLGNTGYLAGTSADLPITVDKYVPTITVDVSPTAVTWGGSYTVRATIGVPAGGFALSGQLTIYEGSTPISVHTVNGTSQLSWQTVVQADEIEARDYSAVLVTSSPAHEGATSPTVTYVVGGLPTTILFTQGTSSPVTPSQVFTLNVVPPGWTSAVPYPSGTVELRTIDGALLGSAAVAPFVSGTALGEITVTGLGVGTHDLIATYLPDGASKHATSTLPISYTVMSRTVNAFVGANPQIVQAGDTVTATASVDPQVSGPFVPAGTIVVTASSGESCTIAAPGGTCDLVLASIGTQSLSAAYSGDQYFAPAASTPATVIVGKATAAASITASNLTPTTGDPVTVAWQVVGPTSGSVTLSPVLADAGCPTTLVGSCVVTFDRARGVEWLVVTFAGDDDWTWASATEYVNPVGCYPLSLSVIPSHAGTLVATTAPNCAGGTRYLTGTAVTVVATPTAATPSLTWRLDGIGISTTSDPTAVIVISDQGPNGAGAFFSAIYHCVTVTLAMQQPASGLARYEPTTQPTCPVDGYGPGFTAGWGLSGGTYTGRFLVGSTVSSAVTVLDRTGEVDVYGYRWNGAAVSQRTPGAFTVQSDTSVTAVLGYRCYRIDTRADGPGAVVMGTAPNCADPRNTWTGWTAGTKVDLVAVPRDFNTGVVTGWVGADGNGTPAPRNARYESTTGPLQLGPASSANTVTIGQPGAHRVVTATFNQCQRVTVSNGIMPQYGSGAVAIVTPGNCSLYPGDTGWFLQGTRVTVRATPAPIAIMTVPHPITGATLVNARVETIVSSWQIQRTPTSGTRSTDSSPAPVGDVIVTVDAPMTVRVQFATLLYDSGMRLILTGTECFPLTARSSSPQLEVSAESSLGQGSCSKGSLSGAFASSVSGTFPIQDHEERSNFTASARAVSGDPLIGWSVDVSDATKPWRLPVGTTAVGGKLTYYQANGGVVATAVACQTIEPIVALTNSFGVTEEKPAPDGSYFVMASPAPNCPYADYAWRVGTEVEVAALADPAGYTFTGWGGAASGVALATKITLDGASPSIPVRAAYNVTCSKLTLTHDAKDVTASPAPNCPGYAASERMYATGTAVALLGKVPSGKVWLGWVGDVVRTPALIAARGANYAVFEKVVYVVMDEDKSAGHRWRSKDWDEEVVDGLTSAANATGDFFVSIGDEVAITMKKIVAVVALMAEEAMSYLPPIGVIQLLAGASSLVGNILEAAGVSVDATKWLQAAQQFSDWMLSAVSCAAVWGFNGNGSQNLFASAADGGGDDNDLVAGAKDAASLADRIASGELTSEESIRAAASEALSTYETVTGTRDTVMDTVDLVSEARAAYFRTASTAARVADDIIPSGFGLGSVLTGAGIILGGGFGIDASAKAAWTDGSAYFNCMIDRIPDFMGGPK